MTARFLLHLLKWKMKHSTACLNLTEISQPIAFTDGPNQKLPIQIVRMYFDEFGEDPVQRAE
jgi:hypothetical protein